MRLPRLFAYSFAFLGASLGIALGTAASGKTAEPAGIQKVNYGSPLFQPKNGGRMPQYKPEEKCAGNSYTIFGKAWGPGWVDGGLTSQPQAEARKATFQNVFKAPEKIEIMPGLVTLVIIDYFSPTKIDLGSPQPALNVSHGDLVLAHTRSILESQGMEYTKSENYSNHSSIYYFESLYGKRIIKIKTFDVSKFKDDNGYGLVQLESIIKEIENFILYPEDHNMYYDENESVVINMSFSLIPCQAAVAFKNYKDNINSSTNQPQKYLDGFIEELRAANPFMAGWSYDKIMQYILEVIPNNPFIEMLKESVWTLRQDRIALAVAASGNYGLSTDTYPAHLPEVISVGAVNWQTLESHRTVATVKDTRMYWSGRADVYSAGGWFKLDKQKLAEFCTEAAGQNCVLEGNVPDELDELDYQGTSFAAPSVAAYFALRATPETPTTPCYPRNTVTGFRFKKTATSNPVELRPNPDWHEVIFKFEGDLLLSKYC